MSRIPRVRVTALWLASWCVVMGSAAIGNRDALSGGSALARYVALWNQWDTQWFESIVDHGYVGPHVSDFLDFHYNVAFFPGLPLLMRAGAVIGLSPVAAGLVISLVSGWVACLALSRLMQQVGGNPEWGVLAWVAAPTALFIAAAYTEALFAAFAFWAWTYARERRWIAAGVLAGFAALVRPNGLFLGLGLLVMWMLVAHVTGGAYGHFPCPSCPLWVTSRTCIPSPAAGRPGLMRSATSGIDILLTLSHHSSTRTT